MAYSIVYYLKKGYALCRRLLLVPRDCHLGGMMPGFVILGAYFRISGAPWGLIGISGPPWGTMGAAGWSRGCK